MSSVAEGAEEFSTGNPSSTGNPFQILNFNVCSINSPRFYVTITIRNLSLPALIDTGAACGILFKSDLFYDLQRQGVRLTPMQGTLGVANGNEAEIRGKCYPRVQIGSSTWKGTCYLVKGLTYPAIIGWETLHDLKATLDIFNRKLSLQGQHVHEAKEVLDVFSLNSIGPPTIYDSDKFPELPHETENIVNLSIDHPQVSQARLGDVKQFLLQWEEKFKTSPGITNVTTMKLWRDPNMPPIKQRYYPLSPIMQKAAAEQVDALLEKGLIVPSESPWSSPAFLLPKKNNTWRLTVDYREVNKVCRKNAYPLPRIQDTLDLLKGSFFISNLDLNSAYHQIPMDPASQELTAFSVQGKGHYEYRVMPFGLSTAPAIFQATMEKVLAPVIGKHTHVYLDDIIIASETFEEHKQHLEAVFNLLFKAGFKLNWEKCFFMKQYTEFLGFIVGQGKIQVSPKKTEAVMNYPRPRTLKQLRGFLSLLSWMRRHIPNLAELSSPLTEMLRKDTKMYWTDARNDAFLKLKQCLLEPPVLCAPDFNLPFEVHCDASNVAIGAVLLQKVEEAYQVIAYASRVLSQPERNYSTTEKECLAVIFALEKWRPYIQGQQTIVKTDHSSLTWLQNIKNPAGRLARWVARLSPYDLDIRYTKGKDNVVPDALSRAVDDPDESTEVATIFPDLTPLPPFQDSSDPWYIALRQSISNNPKQYPSFRLIDDEIVKLTYTPMTNQLVTKRVVPNDHQAHVLRLYHDSLVGGHLGAKKTYHRIAQTLYWPKMWQTIKNYVHSCVPCQQYKARNVLSGGEMNVKEVTELKPFQIVSMDLVGPLPMSRGKKQFILVLVDQATKFIIGESLTQATTNSVIKVIEKKLFLEHGVPNILLTDNGSQFTSKKMKTFCASYGVQLHTTPFYFPAANATERYNRTIKTALAIFATDDHRSWDEHLPYVIFCLRTAVSEVTGFTPSKLVFGRELNCPFSTSSSIQHGRGAPFTADKYHEDLTAELQIIYEKAKQAYQKAKTTQLKQYNMRHRPVQFNQGNLVWRKNFELSKGGERITAKLNPKFIGPFKVSKVLSTTQYQLEDLRGKDCGRWHVSHLQPINGDSLQPPSPPSPPGESSFVTS